MTGGRLQARARATSSDEHVLLDLRRRRRRRRHRARWSRSTARTGKLATRDRGAAARPLRRARSSTATRVAGFTEKPQGDGGWINGGFFVLEPEVARLHRGRRHDLGARAARAPRRATASSPPTATTGFWQPMDTLRDKGHLENLWETGKAPWKIWWCGFPAAAVRRRRTRCLRPERLRVPGGRRARAGAWSATRRWPRCGRSCSCSARACSGRWSRSWRARSRRAARPAWAPASVIRRAALAGGAFGVLVTALTLALSVPLRDRLFDGDELLVVGLALSLPATRRSTSRAACSRARTASTSTGPRSPPRACVRLVAGVALAVAAAGGGAYGAGGRAGAVRRPAAAVPGAQGSSPSPVRPRRGASSPAASAGC